jgi:hypothetical protein
MLTSTRRACRRPVSLPESHSPTMRNEQKGNTGRRPGQRPAPLYPAVVAIVASSAILAYLVWKYYGIKVAALIVIFVLFALFRVLRPTRGGRQRFRA